MSSHIVEIIASDELSLKLVSGITKACRVLKTYAAVVEACLTANESACASIAYTCIGIEVETIGCNSWRRQTMEAIDNEY